MARIMAPFLTLVALAAVFMGMLNALGHFFVPALSPAMFNVATIVIAVVARAARAAAWRRTRSCWWRSRRSSAASGNSRFNGGRCDRKGYRYRPTLDLRDPALGRVLLLMGPGTIGMAATQINVLVNTHFATG